jgi:hypothetical protein
MQTLERTTIDAAKSIDLVALIGANTPLRKSAANEWSGPCPKCGGEDRLHCTASWWFCRQCHAKRGDAIEYIRWLKNVSFRQAVEDLAGAPAQPPARPSVRPAARPAAQPAQPDWSQRCERLVANGMDRLWSTAGAAGRDYLAGRNLAEHTWLAWRIGLADVFVPGTKERAPAILLPWYTTAGHLVAIRYRFLSGTPKMTAEPGSAFAGRLFGAQLLPAPTDPVAHRTLLVCEGEFNAMSIWQVSHNAAMDIVSLGSESAHIPDAAVQFAQRYGRRMVWSDKPSVAQRLMQQLAGAYGVASPNGMDANDLHKQHQLGGFLATARADAASGMDELLKLVWDLRDAADVLAGLDTSSALAAQTLSLKIGVDVGLVEAETNRWIPRERL